MGLRKELWNDLDRGLQYLEPAFIRASRLRVIFLCELLPSDLLINPKGHLKHPKQATREKLDYKLFRAPSCIENPPGHWTRKSSAVGVVGRVKPPGPGRAPEKSTWWVSSWQLRLNLEATKTHLWLTCRVWINYTLFNPVKANALQVWMWPLISAISKAHGLHWTETILKQHCFQYGKLITPSYAWSKFTLVPLHLSMPAGCLPVFLSTSTSCFTTTWVDWAEKLTLFRLISTAYLASVMLRMLIFSSRRILGLPISAGQCAAKLNDEMHLAPHGQR